MTEPAGTGDERTLSLRVSAEQLVRFFPMLQEGVALRAVVNVSIGEFLREQLGLSPEIIEKRVQTVFLDGRPVDDIERAIVRDGSTLAVAPAMPGLMGAMLRRGGYYAPMRGGITHRADASQRGSVEGRITMKLFGMALRELGPRLLARGVELGGEELAQLLESLPEDCRWKPGGAAGVAGRQRFVLKVEIVREEKK